MRDKFIILFTFLSVIVSAQNQVDTSASSLQTDSLTQIILAPGQVVEHIDSFYYKTEALQKKINLTKCPQLVNGYRVQLFSCSGEGCKEKALKYYNQFLIAYPSIPVYKTWQPPTLKVRAGDCRTRFEAEEIKHQIKDDFPFVFIVPDFINSMYKIDCEEMFFSKTDSILSVNLRENKE